MNKIPDISHYHPVDDWNLVRVNVDMLISKATQGTAYIDPTLYDFVEGCERENIPYWLYAYLNKGNEIAQTKFLVSVCKNIVGPQFLGYVLDVEADNTERNVSAALEWLKTQGKPTMVYFGWSDRDMYKNIIDNLGDTLWWEARYGPDDGEYHPSYPCHAGVNLHQFTSEGTCPGISGTCDLSRYVDYTEPAKEEPAKEGKAYSGTWPAFPDGRECYKNGDGIVRMTNYPTQIKRVQKLLKWITGNGLTIDGKFGRKTEAACKEAQEIIGANVDGIFGTQTLRLARNYRKQLD